MSGKINVVCRWGGRICDDNVVGVSYEGGLQGSLQVKLKSKFDDFIGKMHTLTGFGSSEYKITITARFPSYVGPPDVKYMKLDVTNNGSLRVALSVVKDHSCISFAEMYLDIEALNEDEYEDTQTYYSPPHEAEYENTQTYYSPPHAAEYENTQTYYSPPRPTNQNLNMNYADMDFENQGNEGPSSSHVPNTVITPFEAVVNVVDNEVDGTSYWDREGVEWQVEIEPESEDDVIEEIDNNVIEGIDNDNDDDDTDDGDDAAPLPRLHEPVSSFYTDIGEDLPAAYYTPPGVRRSNEDDIERDDLRKGMTFKDKQSLILKVAEYNINRMKEYRVGNTSTKVWEAICKRKDSGCNWKLRGSIQKKHGQFEIVTYHGPHTCLFPIVREGHSQINARIISNSIENFIRQDPSYKVSSITTLIKQQFNYNISYFKAWYAKQKVIASIFGGWETSYTRLPKFMMALQRYNPGTVVSHTVRQTHTNEEVVFERIFWSFRACIDAYRHLRPILCIDATHLYGKYKGKLLIAQGLDANRNVLPLAFAIVDEESANNWGWFLRLVRNRCIIPHDREICLIADRHAGILAAIRNARNGWTPPLGYHRFCLRHFRSNFMTLFKNNTLKLLVWEAGTQTQLRKFNEKMRAIRDIKEEAYNWLMAADLEKWTLVYDGGRRWGETTTNIVESFNGVLKGARSLPITACVQIIFYRVVKYFEIRRSMGVRLTQGGVSHSKDAQKRYLNSQRRSGLFNVTVYNRGSGEASVLTRKRNTQVVIINDRTCTCGKWTTYKVPCSHAQCACTNLGVDSIDLIDEAFSIRAHCLTYESELHPLHHEDYWAEHEGPRWIPDKEMVRGKGRPRSRRFTNEMDVRSRNRCGVCQLPGHDRRTCPSRPGHNAAGPHMH